MEIAGSGRFILTGGVAWARYGIYSLIAISLLPAAATSGESGFIWTPEIAPLACSAAGVVVDGSPEGLALLNDFDVGCVAGAAREQYMLAAADLARICDLIQAGGLTPELSFILVEAESRVATARAVMDDAEANLQAVAIMCLTDRVGPSNAAIATRVASNLSRRVPDAWKALDLPQESSTWAVLESAWFKARLGMPDGAFTQAERDALAMAQADPTVALVQQRLDANLADVEAAWIQWMRQHEDQ